MHRHPLSVLVPALFAALILQAQAPAPPIQLAVDATDAPHKIFHSRLTISAKPGPLTLLYPKWIPGEHGPTGPIVNLTALEFFANDQRIAWRRDDVDMFAFHCEVPPGAGAVEVSLDFLSPAAAEGFSAGSSATDKLAVVNWNQVLLYPSGYNIRDLTYQASLRLPHGWKYGTALPVARESGGTIEFAPAALSMLVDSPVLAGVYYRVLPLTPGETPSHEIDMASDSAAALEMPPPMIGEYKRLVAETGTLFGARHYRDYHFLLTLSDHVTHFGLEHHESSDDRVEERTLLDSGLRLHAAGLLPHEFVHSWNGKYRRPAGLATPDFETPMKGDLLWVYEGLTSYLGDVLTTRSGLWTPEQFREDLSNMGASLDYVPGRNWRPLEDTAVAAQILYGAPRTWYARRRGVDFYGEGVLIWLETDTVIRRQTQGRRSLDDFCRAFYGPPGGPPALKPYTFDDVVAALNDVAPYDWRSFFTSRLNRTGPRAPLGGIENSGWRIVYTETPNEFLVEPEDNDKVLDFGYSIGLRLTRDGEVSESIPGMAADLAGIEPGMKVSAVNGLKWSSDVMREALRAGKKTSEPLELLVSNEGYYSTYRLNYHGGERYPHLERDSTKPDLLTEIIAPHASAAAAGAGR